MVMDGFCRQRRIRTSDPPIEVSSGVVTALHPGARTFPQAHPGPGECQVLFLFRPAAVTFLETHEKALRR
jgi:hypothetical protein